MKKPILIIIDGPNGAGKTTLAKLLHAKLKRTAFIHWDTLKKLISDFKPGKNDHDIANQVTTLMVSTYLKNNISVLYEAFWGPSENIKRLLRALHLPKSRVFIYKLDAPFEVRVKRAKEGWLTGKRKRLLPPEYIKRNDRKYAVVRFPHASILNSHKLSTKQMADQVLKDIKK